MGSEQGKLVGATHGGRAVLPMWGEDIPVFQGPIGILLLEYNVCLACRSCMWFSEMPFRGL